MWAQNNLWACVDIFVSGLMKLRPENLYLNRGQDQIILYFKGGHYNLVRHLPSIIRKDKSRGNIVEEIIIKIIIWLQ